MPKSFERLSAAELAALPRESTVIFYAVGPIEDHGPHLPLDADLIEASTLARMAAERMEAQMPGWVGVLVPPVALGVQGDTTHFALTVRPYVLRDWLVDTSYALYQQGFRRFACFSGHAGPKQLTAIEDAGRVLRVRAGFASFRRLFRMRQAPPILVSASSAGIPLGESLKAPFWPDPVEHGGKRDTSVVLAIHAKRVDPSYASLPSIAREGSRLSRAFKRKRREVSGYWGSPAEASAEEGQRILEDRLNDVFPKLRAVWEGSNPQALFRSWYSILPSNGSYFRAWTLSVILLGILLLWLTLSLESI